MKTKLKLWSRLSLILFTLLIFNSSCEKNYYDVYEDAYWEIIPFTVQEGHWNWDPNRECYYYRFTDSRITSFVANEGAVNVEIKDGNTYIPLEYTVYRYDEANDYFYGETINYEYGAGFIRFNVWNSDLFDGTPLTYQPLTYVFKVTLHA